MPNREDQRLKKLAELGKEKREAKTLQKEKAKQQQKLINTSNRKVIDQQRIFLHITKWHRFYKTFKIVSIFLGVMALFMLLSFVMLTSMQESNQVSYEVFVYLALVIIILTTIIFIAKNMRDKAVLREVNWINGLPFSLVAYPDFLVYRSYPGFQISINFKNTKPNTGFVLDLLSSLPYEISYDEDHKHAFCYAIENPKGSKFNRHRRWAYYWIHQACDNQLKALHSKYPIEEIVIGEGKKELDFNWWLPLKLNKWWYHWI